MRNFWNLKLSDGLIVFFAALPFFVTAQFSKPEEKFPNGERYMYPVYPGQPGSLAGTMGELRTTHFHSGIDIRTNNVIGLPVVASKSGYISRMASTASSYGNVIYITHPDGNTTLYAHLDKFGGAWGDYFLKEQYQKKLNEVEMYFSPDQFPVKQGELIGLSGNTGSSGGPHLHFDIRDSENYALDPLKVAGFTELSDKLPPAAEKIALRTLDINSRINDRFGRFEFYAQRVGENYVISVPILASGNIGVELVAKDKLAPQSQFFGGVNYIEMKVDSQLVFRQAIEKVNVSEPRAIYTLMDFKTMKSKGTRFYKLYIDDGNELKFYGNSPGSGKISVNPVKDSPVVITMKDSDGNGSKVLFTLKPDNKVKQVTSLESFPSQIAYEVSENTLVVTTKSCSDSASSVTIYKNGLSEFMQPAYFNKNRQVFLIDLRKSVPDSIISCDGRSVSPRIVNTIPSGTEYKYYSDMMEIQFPLNALYDTLYLNADYTTDKSLKEIFTVGSRNVPLGKNIEVMLKPQRAYSHDKNVSAYRASGRSYTYLGGEWVNDRIKFTTREFGDFVILKDSIAPFITPVNVHNQNIRFKIRDDLSGINTYQATLNGEWLLMYHDAKSNSITSKPLDPKMVLRGNFELTVTDNAGNTSRYSKKIP